MKLRIVNIVQKKPHVYKQILQIYDFPERIKIDLKKVSGWTNSQRIKNEN